MSNKAVVHLRVYRNNGRDNQISYNADGSVQNENILVKLTYNTLEWTNYLKHLLVNGFVKVKVEKVIGEADVKAIEKEVEKAMHPKVEVVLSPEQKKIADLEAKLDSLMGKSDKSEKKVTVFEVEENPIEDIEVDAEKVETIEEIRKQYKEKLGKRAFPGWSIEELKEKMNK
ncbi:MAG: hypothetical protein ABFS35_17830 [Bacteroidota bacterium]